MNKKILTLWVMFIMFMVGIGYAGADVDDVITIKTDIYDNRRKSAVEFTHTKHIEEYNYSCGSCHHDNNGNSLCDLKMTDEVQSCVKCHDKSKGDRKDIMVLENAMHESCIGCHKSYNEENFGDARRGPSPTRCSACHPRE